MSAEIQSGQGSGSRFLHFMPWLCAALAYSVAFLQRVGLQTFVDRLAVDFHTGADGVGVLVSGYFYGYVALQIPAGILVDTFGVRRVVLASLMISCLGTLVFATAGDLSTAFAGRMIAASGDALIFTATIKMVAQGFEERQFGLMSGLSQVSGYIGGMLATTPLTLLVASIGWRPTFGGIAGILACNVVACFLILPRNGGANAQTSAERWVGVGEKLRASLSRMLGAFRTVQAWGCAMIFASHFVAVTSLTAAWGIPMLMQAYGMTRTEASTPMLVFMLMNIVGSIGFGYLSDRIRDLPGAMLSSCMVRIALLVMAAPWIGMRFDVSFIIALFGAFGVVSGSMVPLILKYLKSVYSSDHVATGVAMNSTLAGIIGGLFQPLIGLALEATWSGSVDANGRHYSVEGFNLMIGLLAVISPLGVIGPLLLRARARG